MSVKLTMKDTLLKAKLKDLAEIEKRVMPLLYAEFEKDTPIRSGYARQHTLLSNNIIDADYVYAQRLDEGYSKQAPKGMSQPTLELAKKIIPALIQQIASKR